MLIWEMTFVDRSADGKKRSPNCAITGLNRCNREFFAVFVVARRHFRVTPSFDLQFLLGNFAPYTFLICKLLMPPCTFQF